MPIEEQESKDPGRTQIPEVGGSPGVQAVDLRRVLDLEDAGGAEKHRHVGIVAASVHLPFVLWRHGGNHKMAVSWRAEVMWAIKILFPVNQAASAYLAPMLPFALLKDCQGIHVSPEGHGWARSRAKSRYNAALGDRITAMKPAESVMSVVGGTQWADSAQGIGSSNIR